MAIYKYFNGYYAYICKAQRLLRMLNFVKYMLTMIDIKYLHLYKKLFDYFYLLRIYTYYPFKLDLFIIHGPEHPL